MLPVLKMSHSKSYKMPKDRNFCWRAAHFVGHVSCLLPKAQTDRKQRAVGQGLTGPRQSSLSSPKATLIVPVSACRETRSLAGLPLQ